MATQNDALAALRTIAEDAAEKYGVDLVLAAMRDLLRPHLTEDGVKAANDAADELERLKFGPETSTGR